MSIPKMRTINEVCAELKKLDPASAITPYFIRRLALGGNIICIRSGNKMLINLDSVITYLNNPTANQEINLEEPLPGLRPVPANLKFVRDFDRGGAA